METILQIIIGICGLIYFCIGFVWFMTSNNPMFKFFGWIEKEVKSLTISKE